ncbi:hypothetical protein [Alcaligenes faecalis]|uniref:hypothetical protein n=1 Tax=Alcaligenes faecalis TaxID=511 RepID=UPI0011B1E89B|nr:hypothetical protein [Alcaligenes faecalis]
MKKIVRINEERYSVHSCIKAKKNRKISEADVPRKWLLNVRSVFILVSTPLIPETELELPAEHARTHTDEKREKLVETEFPTAMKKGLQQKCCRPF